jgi:asparagine synthase (glutamine-hydrolysing)
VCGICGFIKPKGFKDSEARETLERMNAKLFHRGPDATGVWIDSRNGIALGHRRLSVLDLSPAGKQPMISASERYVLSFNGEIYNHRELRNELKKSSVSVWRGHSDTETFLSAIEKWGLSEALAKSTGMFAFALWDSKESILTLARDRMGEKPLYYGWQRGVFLFGSELKALRVHPAFENELDRGSLPLFLKYKYVPAPHSIYKGIKKLEPGTMLRISSNSGSSQKSNPETYWSFRKMVESGISSPFRGDRSEAVSEIERILGNAVSQQSMADVPLGAFLSGGIDSSAIVALMQSKTSSPVKTFTIGFGEKGYNEAVHAKAVAQHLGTDHHELYVTPNDAMDVIPSLPDIFDEPFADSSQIPTYLVAKMAKENVTVSLSGDGGDELFGGYNRYSASNKFWDLNSRIPFSLRGLLSLGINYIPQGLANVIFCATQRRSGKSGGDYLMRIQSMLKSEGMSEFYASYISEWQQINRLLIYDFYNTESDKFTGDNGMNDLRYRETMMYSDSTNYLPDDILAKVDRTAMSVSLETRVPMMDHNFQRFCWSLPEEIRLADGIGSKSLLKELVYKFIPKQLLDRPKMGFGIPVGKWIIEELRDWAEDLLSERSLAQTSVFDSKRVRKIWHWHLTERFNYTDSLWTILVFQQWARENLG